MCIVVEKDVDLRPDGATLVHVKNGRKALAALSAEFYGHPSRSLKVIGVTGTNGKTTITYLIDSVLAGAGYRTGLLGTIVYRLGQDRMPALPTTPDSPELQAMLREMVDGGVQYAAMEVSSHALALYRVDGVRFHAAVLSNVSHDHMDFHRNFTDYCRKKLRLFKPLASFGDEDAYAVINRDDPSSSVFLSRILVRKVTYGLSASCDIRAEDIQVEDCGSRLLLVSARSKVPVTVNLPGEFNIYNALAAAAVGLMEGASPEEVAAGIASVTHIPGRYQTIDCGQDFTVIVDFVHNPDALRKILSIPVLQKKEVQAVRGRKIVVFGCEGQKDTLKRPLMGSIAASLADLCIITSDNIYNEDPEEIVREVEVGVKEAGMYKNQYWIIVDRRRAIERALELAERGDLVIIAGKGHETYQVVGNRQVPFDDRLVVTEILSQKTHPKEAQ